MQLLASLLRFKVPALGFVLAAAAAGSVHAQQAAVGLPGQRQFGQRYVDTAVGWVDAEKLGDRGRLGAVGINLPLTANADLGVSSGYGTLDTTNGRLADFALNTTLVAHSGNKGPNPFLGVIVGYERLTQKAGGRRETENTGVWGIGGGLEVPVGALTLTPGLAFTDTFHGDTVGTMHYGIEVAGTVSRGVGLYGSATWSKFNRGRGETWTYRAGMRFTF